MGLLGELVSSFIRPPQPAVAQAATRPEPQPEAPANSEAQRSSNVVALQAAPTNLEQRVATIENELGGFKNIATMVAKLALEFAPKLKLFGIELPASLIEQLQNLLPKAKPEVQAPIAEQQVATQAPVILQQSEPTIAAWTPAPVATQAQPVLAPATQAVITNTTVPAHQAV